MENNETWRERFADLCNDIDSDPTEDRVPRKRLAAFFASELLSLADKIGGEKKNPTEDQEHGLEYDEGFDSALDTAISIIKEMVK